MARNRTTPTHYPDKFDVKNYKDLRRGMADDEFWDEEELIEYPSSNKKKKKRKRVPGCPGNEGKAHVYVWTSETEHNNAFFRYFGFHKYENKVCAGCGKRVYGGYRHTEKYIKKFKPVGRWDYPERNHAGYHEYRTQQREKFGWSFFY